MLLYSDISRNFTTILHNLTDSQFLIILLYFTAFFIIYTIISFPFSYIDGYIIEHKYGFSTQNFKKWLIDQIKAFVVSFILGTIVFEVIYTITALSSNLWWLWLSIIMIIFSIILANLFPVLILPLFYKTSPIENEDLKQCIAEITNRAKINVKGIFSINLSSKSTKANAAVVGLGNTKKILIGDTLIGKYNEGEIISTLAHEIIHYKEHHIWLLVLWQSLITLIMFYIFFKIHHYFYHLLGFKNVSDIAAFPLFALIFAILSFLSKPFGSAISRYYEKRADKGLLNLTKNPESFISLMARFCNDQLIIAYPNPLIEWYSYSHPSPGKRIKSAEAFRNNA